MTQKIICFDIDGVICKTHSNNYDSSKPIKKNIKVINNLFDKGFKIKLHTARYMGRSKDNRLKAELKIKKITINQLKKLNVKYHKIFFGKPSFDLVIDDKSIFYKIDWSKKIKKILNKT